jgi:Major Facilitator Superfamily
LVAIILLPPRRRGLWLFASLAAFGLLLAACSASSWLPLSVAIMGLFGVAQAVYLATNNTLVQLAVPNSLQGRVMSVSMTTWGLMPLGALPRGILADWFGAPLIVAGSGLLSCLVVARWPSTPPPSAACNPPEDLEALGYLQRLTVAASASLRLGSGSMARATSSGKCTFCGGTVGKSAMTRHLTACKLRPPEPEKTQFAGRRNFTT